MPSARATIAVWLVRAAQVGRERKHARPIEGGGLCRSEVACDDDRTGRNLRQLLAPLARKVRQDPLLQIFKIVHL
jgi:hypothetical protein